MPSIASRSSVMRVPVMRLDPVDDGADSPPPLPLPLPERADCPPRGSQGGGGVFQEGWGGDCSPTPLGFLSPLPASAHTGLGTHRGGEGGKGGEAGGKVDGGGHELTLLFLSRCT